MILNLPKHNISLSLMIFTLIGLTVISFQPLILIPLEKELAYHMIVEHAIFFSMGIISVKVGDLVLRNLVKISKRPKYANNINKSLIVRKNKNNILRLTTWWSHVLRRVFAIKNVGFVWIAITISLLFFWHIPSIFNYATLNANIHIIQHFSFIIVGITGFLSIRTLGESYSIILLLVLGGMMEFVGLVFELLNHPIFSVYSVSGHNYAGIYMISAGISILLIGLPYFLIRKTMSYIKTKSD